MLNSNLVKILATLSKEEMKSFEDFVLSPYFNKKPSAITLFKELKKFHPDFNSELLAKENIYQKLYKGKSFNDGVLRNQMSDLYKLLLKFLGNEGYKKDSMEFNIKISKQLLLRRLPKIFNSYYDDIRKEYEKDNLIENEYYYWYRAVLDEQYDDNILYNGDATRLPINNLYGNNLIYFILIKLFKIMHNLHATEVNTNVYYDKSILREFLGLLDMDELFTRINEISEKDHDIVSIYYNMSKALMDKNDFDSFNKLHELVEKNYMLFADAERYSIYLFLSNIASHSKAGKLVLLDIYKSMLAKKIYKASEDGYLNYMLFSYILTHALAKNELDWLEIFIDKYIGEIEPVYQETMLNYSKAHLYFARKEFNNSLEHINRVKPDNYFFKHQTYRLIIENYYELNEIAQLQFAIDNFKHYLSKGNLSKEWNKYYEGYLAAIKELIKLKEGKEKSKFKIEKCIQESTGDMSWIKQKVAQFDT